MTVYHGSYIEIQNPDISFGRSKLDFGRGFYITTLKNQSEKWARRRSKLVRKNPVVSVYEFDANGLNILSFDGYSEEWLDFVAKNRTGAAIPCEYDAICGNIADDDVATIMNDYTELLRKGRISAAGKRFYLEQLQYSEPNNQYCLVSQKSIEALKFVKSYELGE